MNVNVKPKPRVSYFWAVFFFVLLAAATLTIWSFSMEDGAASTLTSGRVIAFLQKLFTRFTVLERFFGFASIDKAIVQANVRKLAHFIEYAMFGMLSQCLLAAIRKMKVSYMLHFISLGLVVAMIDETIQISRVGRGPALSDVWLDLTGIIFGCIVVWLIYGIGQAFTLGRAKA